MKSKDKGLSNCSDSTEKEESPPDFHWIRGCVSCGTDGDSELSWKPELMGKSQVPMEEALYITQSFSRSGPVGGSVNVEEPNAESMGKMDRKAR